MSLYWIVEATGNPRFPVRIAIEQEGNTLFAVRAQDAWPVANGHIYCIRDPSPKEERDLFREIERVPVLQFDRFGKSLRITLDRPRKKRCEFLILEKKYKHREGTYEQIFFKTQAGTLAHRSRSRVALRPTNLPMIVAIDNQERYPWKFPRAQVERRALPAGDYALLVKEKILGVVERKSYENLLQDFGEIAILHQKLRELTTYPYRAVVIEADYGDFLDPKRLKGRWPPSHGYRVLSELQVMHPNLPFIFARTRKEANLWTYGYFRAILKRVQREEERVEPFMAAEPFPAYTAQERLEDRILTILQSNREGLTSKELQALCPEADSSRIRSILQSLRKRGLVESIGSRASTRWIYRDSSRNEHS